VIVGMDFFTVEAVTWLGLIRYHVLFAIDIASRKVEIVGMAVNPVAPGWSRWRATWSMRSMASWSASGMS
jgi:hypothetical protein